MIFFFTLSSYKTIVLTILPVGLALTTFKISILMAIGSETESTDMCCLKNCIYPLSCNDDYAVSNGIGN